MMALMTVDRYLENPSGNQIILSRIWDEIPLLNDLANHDIVDGSLFRFRGMIQDMSNPVYYYQKYAVQNTLTGKMSIGCGMYRTGLHCSDNETILLDSDKTESSERKPFYCVEIPALNNWARENRVPSVCTLKTEELTKGKKRHADQMEDAKDLEGNLSISVGKRQRLPKSNYNELYLSQSLPDQSATSCVIHVYNGEADSLKLNDVIEVVGFVYANNEDQDDINIPASIAPRLHVVVMRKAPPLPKMIESIDREDVVKRAMDLRSDLHLIITQLLFGDHLAASYLICYLLASIYGRHDDIALGKFSLNLSNIHPDPAYTQFVYYIISLLVPKSVLFPMSIEKMNTTDMVPIKDYDTNRLKPGVLQLSDRTHLIVDETKMNTGQLVERGVKNLQVLNTLLTDQVVNYDFRFYSLPFPVNIPVLVLSEGKSLLQCDVHVKVVPQENFSFQSLSESMEAIQNYLTEPLLSRMRTFLMTVTVIDFNFPADIMNIVQDDLVSLRQEDSRITPEDMHSQLVFARLLSLSFGQTSLTKDIWDQATHLERLRRAR